MSVLLATLIVGAGAGVGVATALAGYAQKNWTRRPETAHTVASSALA
ncbi:hypothetical protein [Pseudonocardia sp. KRD291]|nr:hypothetical protein [Pseudonocardia sp. KRD291]MBW0105691.1 hypothetical protein [Pseudonocardia sp. KRD291]